MNEIIKLTVNILSISEIRWPVAEKKYLGKHGIIYSRTQEYDRGFISILDQQTLEKLEGF